MTWTAREAVRFPLAVALALLMTPILVFVAWWGLKQPGSAAATKVACDGCVSGRAASARARQPPTLRGRDGSITEWSGDADE
jgi:hypothetical protein